MKKILFSTLFIISFFVIATPSFLIAEDNNIPDEPLTTSTDYEKTADQNHTYAQQLFNQGRLKKCIEFCDAAIRQYSKLENSKLEIATIEKYDEEEDGKEVTEINVDIDVKLSDAKKLKQKAEDKLKSLLKEGKEAAEAAKKAKEEGKWKEVQTKANEAIKKLEALQIADPRYKNIGEVTTPLVDARKLQTEADSYLEGEKKFKTGERNLNAAKGAKKNRLWDVFYNKINEAVKTFTELSSTSANMFYRNNKDKVDAKKEEAEKLQEKAETYYKSETYFQEGETALKAAKKAREENPPNWSECLNQANKAITIFEEIKKPDSEYKLFYDTEWWAVGGILENKVILGIKKANKLIAEAQSVEDKAQELFEQANKAIDLASKAKNKSDWNECKKQANKAIAAIEKLKKNFVKTNTYENNKIEINLTLSATAENLQQKAQEEIEIASKDARKVFEEGKEDLEEAEKASKKTDWKTCLSKAQGAIDAFEEIKKSSSIFYNSTEMNPVEFSPSAKDFIKVNQVDKNLERAQELKTNAQKLISGTTLSDGKKALEEAKDAENIDRSIVHSKAQKAIDIFNDIINNQKVLYEDSKDSIDRYLQEAKDLKIKVSTKYFAEGIENLNNANNDKKQGKWKDCLNNANSAETIFKDIKKSSKYKLFYDGQKIVGSKWHEKLDDWARQQLIAIGDYTPIQIGDGKTVDEALSVAQELIKEATMHESDTYKTSEQLYKDGQTIMSQLKEMKYNTKSGKGWKNIQIEAEKAIVIFTNLKKEVHKEFYEAQKKGEDSWWDTIYDYTIGLVTEDKKTVDEYLEIAKALKADADLHLSKEYKDLEKAWQEARAAWTQAEKDDEAEFWVNALKNATLALENLDKIKKQDDDTEKVRKAKETFYNENEQSIKNITVIAEGIERRAEQKLNKTSPKDLFEEGKTALANAETTNFAKDNSSASELLKEAKKAQDAFYTLKTYNNTDYKAFYKDKNKKTIDANLAKAEALETFYGGVIELKEAKELKETSKGEKSEGKKLTESKIKIDLAIKIFDTIQYEHKTFYNTNKELVENKLKEAKNLKGEIDKDLSEKYKKSYTYYQEGITAFTNANEYKNKKDWTNCFKKAKKAATIFTNITTKDEHKEFYKVNRETVGDTFAKYVWGSDPNSVDEYLQAAKALEKEALKNLPEYKDAIDYFEKGLGFLKRAKTAKENENWKICELTSTDAKKIFEAIKNPKNTKYKKFYEEQKSKDSIWSKIITIFEPLETGSGLSKVEIALNKATALQTEAKNNMKYETANKLYSDAQIPLNRATETADNLKEEKPPKQYRNDCNTTVKDYEKAIKELQEAINAGPKDEDKDKFERSLADAKLGLSKTLIRRNQKGDLDDAITNINYIITNDPTNPEIDNIYAYKAIACVKQFIETDDETKLDDAKEALKEAGKEAGKEALGLYGRGLTYLMDAGYPRAADRYDNDFTPFDETSLSEAIEKLELSKTMDDTFAPSLAHLAIAQVFAQKTALPREDYNAITQLLNNAENIDHNDADVYYGKGILEVDKYYNLLDEQAQEKENAIRDAEKALKQTLKLDPNHQNAKKELKKIAPLTKSETQRLKEEWWEKYHEISQLYI